MKTQTPVLRRRVKQPTRSQRRPASTEEQLSSTSPSTAPEVLATQPAQVLQLQRQYGNRAVVRLTAGAPRTVQRKNLTQAGLDGGLGTDGVRALQGSDTRSGKVYTITLGTEYNNRTEALVAAAAENARLGKSLPNPTLWTGTSFSLNNENNDRLDPFFLRVKVKFKQSSNTKEMELLYQHANSWTGYVTRLKDTSNPNLQDRTEMYEEETGPTRDSQKFSNIHDTTDGGNISGMTTGNKEKNLDAYTKIAGEGARWKCVRDHATNIKDGSLFFTQDPDDTDWVLAVSFRTLWGNWASVFSKGYDIANATVALKIKNSPNWKTTPKNVRKTNLTAGDDFNLDTGKSHS